MHNRIEHYAVSPQFSKELIEPCLHTVQFYSEDASLLDAIDQFIGKALAAGHVTIVVATATHREGLAQRLSECGLDLTTALKQGRYIALDAAETLSEFLVDGWPNAVRFTEFMAASSRVPRRRLAWIRVRVP